MKKFGKGISVALVAVMALGLMSCGALAANLKGTVATDGSTSMESVIGALGEAFMEAEPDVTFTYNPTGSGSGIQAVSERLEKSKSN